jgi:dienelactone hydrolase
MAGRAAWERRFTAPQIGFPSWCARAPDRLAYVSNESGSWQAWVHDLATGERFRVTDEPIGVEHVMVAPDGRIVWWRDDVGDERGRWMAVEPGDEPTPLLPGAPDGWASGISFAGDAVAFGSIAGEEYRAYLAGSGEPPRLLVASDRFVGIGREDPAGSGGLSADGRLVCIRHAERSDIVHQALRIVDVDGLVVDELLDPGANLGAAAWSPIPGDPRLVFTSELGPFERPGVWAGAGTRHDLTVDLPGAVIPIGWWPDASGILARHEHEGVDRLVRVDPDTGDTSPVGEAAGEILEAAVRPDGEVWLMASDSSRVPYVMDAAGREVLVPPSGSIPTGYPYRPHWFENPHGDRIQAFVVTPEGEGPWPTVLSVHGGPWWHERGGFDPESLAFVDAGYAVVLPNYRGSTGYGIAFRDALIGDPWFPETEDVVACLDGSIAAGIADPDRVAFSGWSWGGCLACLAAGLHADRFAAVFAGIPSGDFVSAHHACMPDLREFDRAVYGGGPDELPEMWAERNPMTYVDRVRAPVLVIAGENDPRCPPEGIIPWVDALRVRGVPVEAHFYPEGHHANRIEQQVHHMRLILDFFGRYV